MSNEAEQEPDFEQALDQLADEGQKQIEDEDQHEQLSDLEQEAVSGGWTTKIQWIADGKDPARHKSAHEFVEYGKINTALNVTKQQMDQMRSDFDGRIGNLNKLHDQQRESDIKALRAEQRKAVDERDTEAFDEAQAQIEGLEGQKATSTDTDTTANQKLPEVIAWEASNTWSQDPADARTIAANAHLQAFVAKTPGATVQAALDYVDGEIGKMTAPATNTRRDNPTGHERSGGGGRQRSGGKLGMSDLTSDEKQLWRTAGFDLWGNDEKAFLQSVTDSRKGQ